MTNERTFDFRSLLDRWRRTMHDAWFAPADPRLPAVCRIILFAMAVEGFPQSGAGGHQDFVGFRPMGLLAALHVPVFSSTTLTILGWIYPFVSACALLGLFYPVTGIATAALFTYLEWVLQSSGKINHGGLLHLCALFPIALARAADAWSIDALIRHLRGYPEPTASGAYRWPSRFISLMVVTMYGTAGLTKLVRTGWTWAISDSMRIHFLSHQFTHSPPTRIGPWLAQSPFACRALATASLFLEVGAPLAQFSRWAYRIIIPSLALLQFGIWLIMGVLFREMALVFLCLLPWELALAQLDKLTLALRTRLVTPSGAG